MSSSKHASSLNSEGWGSKLRTPSTAISAELPSRGLNAKLKGSRRGPSNSSHTQVLPVISTPLSRILELFSVVAGKGQSSEYRGSTAERRVAREGLLTKESDPSKRHASRGRPTISSATPPNATLTTHPSNGPGPTAPTRADS
ncbi:unnamed protein product [Sphagnum troendelagicum]|uniref:Uncharacterized protein n=1 Tax=Sphagnum troendelagicum TaxID=128251 RepID=A0ABP0UUG6_9BRYO